MALNTETAFAQAPPNEFRADAERLSNIVLEMQRCFVLHLCKELAPGNVSFPQFFLLAYLDQKEVLTMTAIAQKMGHTTAAASGLVARLENHGISFTRGAESVAAHLQQNLRLLPNEGLSILCWQC